MVRRDQLLALLAGHPWQEGPCGVPSAGGGKVLLPLPPLPQGRLGLGEMRNSSVSTGCSFLGWHNAGQVPYSPPVAVWGHGVVGATVGRSQSTASKSPALPAQC